MEDDPISDLQVAVALPDYLEENQPAGTVISIIVSADLYKAALRLRTNFYVCVYVKVRLVLRLVISPHLHHPSPLQWNSMIAFLLLLWVRSRDILSTWLLES